MFTPRPICCAALLLALFTPAAAAAQTVLEVHVTDPAGTAVAGARVQVSTRDARFTATAETGNDGVARLDISCDCVLEVTAGGFSPASAAVASGDRRIDVPLSVAGIAERVVVTATGTAQIAVEASKAIDVVEAAEISARGEFAVADAVRTLPGLTVQQLGGPGTFTSIKMRGLREQDTVILLDGEPLRDATAPKGDSTGVIGELYLTNLDRVEVLRGSGSSVHGSHAVAGAVNLITRQGGGPFSGESSVEAGQLGFTRITGHAGGAAGRIAYSLGAGRTETSRGVDGDDRSENTSIQGRADVRLTSSAQLSARTYLSDGTVSLNESPTAVGRLPASGTVRAVPSSTFVPAENDPDARRESEFGSSSVSFDHRPSPRAGYGVSLRHAGTARVFVDGPLGVSPFEPASQNSTILDGGLTTLVARGDLEMARRQTLSARYELERESYRSEAFPSPGPAQWSADLRQTRQSVSLQHQWRSAIWQVATGVRAETFSLGRAMLAPAERSPFAGAVFARPPSALTGDVSVARWFEQSGTKLHAHFGNAFRAPAMYERAGVSFGTFGYTVYGDPGLEPERSVSFDAGLNQTMADGRLQVGATWFYTRLLHLVAFGAIDATRDPFRRSFGYLGGDGRTAHGIEASARMQPAGGTTATLSYTFADAEAPRGNLEGLPRASGVPAHQVSVLLMEEIGRFSGSFELEAASDHYVALFDPVSFGARAYRFDGTLKADAALAYSHPAGRARLRLFTVIDNVFDRAQFVQGFVAPGRVARGGVGVTF